MIHVWLGIAHRPGTSLWISPLMAVSYLTPLLFLPGDFAAAAGSFALVLPTCLIVAEALARSRRRLLQTEGQRRVHSSELERANRPTVERAREVRSVLHKLRKVEAQLRRHLSAGSEEAAHESLARA